ncbi:thioredoxin family protein [soil metagenome]
MHETIRKHISASYTDRGMYYEEYRRLIDAFLMVGKSTAKKESESLVEYSKLNVVRMNRLDKTIEIIPELREKISEITAPQTWLVLTEGWCGDAAQIVPVLNKLAALNSNITLRFLLRDEHLELMDQYLTNSKSRSIPKLVALDENNNELFNWGPRPKVLQEMFYHMKANAMNNDTIKEEIHKRYAADKTMAIQKDLLELMSE